MRIIVATTEATGAVHGPRLHAGLRETATEPHAVFSRLAGATRTTETHAKETERSAREPAFIATALALNSNPKTLDEVRRSDRRRAE
jgi:3-polyprenyl-4-hydroxybenzoate decarboxylase